MRAVIMAGGAGTRLRPLTCRRPKPMMPVANKPLIAHTVSLLKKHGIREIILTLQYLPQVVQRYLRDGAGWGVSIRYSVEDEALGTAGGVRLAAEHIKDTFLVVSGDALTDFDLSAIVSFHRSRGALLTVALARVSDPRHFGVVGMDETGRVTRFAEKPGPGEAFSDLVNTGIYVMEPEALAHVPKGASCDFSRHLIPLLMARGEPVFACRGQGYWCDVGTPERYVQANFDALAGAVGVELPGCEVAAGVRLGRGVEVCPGARLEGPLVVGDGAVIAGGAHVGAYAVVGAGCVIAREACVERAVLLNGTYVGAGSRVSGLVACEGSGGVLLAVAGAAWAGQARAAGGKVSRKW